jgi:hypothetical protein
MLFRRITVSCVSGGSLLLVFAYKGLNVRRRNVLPFWGVISVTVCALAKNLTETSHLTQPHVPLLLKGVVAQLVWC